MSFDRCMSMCSHDYDQDIEHWHLKLDVSRDYKRAYIVGGVVRWGHVWRLATYQASIWGPPSFLLIPHTLPGNFIYFHIFNYWFMMTHIHVSWTLDLTCNHSLLNVPHHLFLNLLLPCMPYLSCYQLPSDLSFILDHTILPQLSFNSHSK